MKALQKTLVVKRQYSEDLKEIFMSSGVEQQYATLGQAENIIKTAKSIMKSRNAKLGKFKGGRKPF